MISLLTRPVGGDDIFISYSRTDAVTYAAGLANSLAARRLSCRFDQWAASPGMEIPNEILRALRRSSMLVIVGTIGAAASQHVRKEIETFLPTRRRIVPIDVDGSLRGAQWWHLLAGLAISIEPGAGDETARVIPSSPSENVIDRIEHSIDFTRRDLRLRRNARIALITFVVLLASAGAAAILAITKQNEARRQQHRADESKREVLRQQKLARTAGLQADFERQEAARQQEIAAIRRLANQSETSLAGGPESVIESAREAIEAAQRSYKLDIHILESDTAIRDVLAILPEFRGSISIKGEVTEGSMMKQSVVLSPDLKFAGLITYERKTNSVELRIVDRTRGSEALNRRCDYCEGLALSSSCERFAYARHQQNPSIDIESRNGAFSRHIDFASDSSLLAFALSPDGKFLAVVTWDNYSRQRMDGGDIMETDAELWDVDENRAMGKVPTPSIYQVDSVTFSPNGKRLAFGGVGFGPRGETVGRAAIADLNGLKGEFDTAELGSPVLFEQPEEIGSIAVDNASRLVATSGSATASVWDVSSEFRPVVVTRVPISRRVYGLAFSPDARLLLTLSEAKRSHGKRDGLEIAEWDASGYTAPVIPAEATTRSGGANLERTVAPRIGPKMKNLDFASVDHSGRYLALVVQRGEQYVDEQGPFNVVLWNRVTSQPIRTINCDAWVRKAEFSPDDTYLAVGDKRGDVRIADLSTGNVTILHQFAAITELSWSGAILASGDENGEVVVFDMKTRQETMRLHSTGIVRHAEFLSGGRSLAVTTELKDERFASVEMPGGQRRVWALDFRDLLAEGCHRIARFTAGAETGCHY